jgi:hypothetical protein
MRSSVGFYPYTINDARPLTSEANRGAGSTSRRPRHVRRIRRGVPNHALIEPFAAGAEGARILRDSPPPTLEEVKGCIASAKAALARAA